jgi:hypothetical protein
LKYLWILSPFSVIFFIRIACFGHISIHDGKNISMKTA